MSRNMINNLKIFNGVFGCFSHCDDGKKKIYDIVKDNKRHIYAVTDKDEIFEGISKVGTNNKGSDSFIIVTHPKDDRYKMMLIADGVGRLSDSKGKRKKNTSEFITDNLKKWFSSLNRTSLELFNTREFNRTLKVCLRKMDEKMRNEDDVCEAKMIMSIIGPEQTIIANIGDLRCYLSKGYDIGQYNEEDSKLWNQYREGYFWNKEEFRFNVNRDKNVSKFGKDKDGFLSTYVINNDMYDRIYLFSRGIIEGISEDRLLSLNTDVPADGVVEAIVDTATDGKKEYISFYMGDAKHLEPIVRGTKDSTACMYVKKLKK